MLESFFMWEGEFLMLLQEQVRTPFLTAFFQFITSLGNAGWFWITASVILLFFKKTRKAGMLALVSLLVSFVFNNLILKNIFARIRPYEVIDGLKLLIPKPMDYSFPSGHSAASFVTAVSFYQNLPRKIGVPALILAALIAFSRLYLGVHYPSDVIFGSLSGAGIAILVNYVYMRKKS